MEKIIFLAVYFLCIFNFNRAMQINGHDDAMNFINQVDEQTGNNSLHETALLIKSTNPHKIKR